MFADKINMYLATVLDYARLYPMESFVAMVIVLAMVAAKVKV